jgi:hypothetical protein
VLEARLALDHGHADFLGRARIDGRFENRHAAATNGATDRATGGHEWGEVGTLGRVDRGRHSDDEHVTVGEIGSDSGQSELRRRAHFFR